VRKVYIRLIPLKRRFSIFLPVIFSLTWPSSEERSTQNPTTPYRRAAYFSLQHPAWRQPRRATLKQGIEFEHLTWFDDLNWPEWKKRYSQISPYKYIRELSRAITFGCVNNTSKNSLQKHLETPKLCVQNDQLCTCFLAYCAVFMRPKSHIVRTGAQ